MKKQTYYCYPHIPAYHKRKSKDSRMNITERNIPYEIEVVARDLMVPWALDIDEEGTIYVTERVGRIRKIQEGRLLPQPLITFGPPFISRGEGGLMGIVLDPNFRTNRFLYVMFTYAEGNQVFNRVVRLVEENNRATVDRILVDNIPGGRIHNGGQD